MFGRLSCHLYESSKLKILLRNIQPFNQNQLGLTVITGIEQLKTLYRKLEARRETIQNFIPPSWKNALEPDLAYVDSVTSDRFPMEEMPRSSMLCFNCDEPGHKAVG